VSLDGGSLEGPSKPELLEVGRIGKAHGLKGEVVVHLFTDRQERVATGSMLQTAKGPMVIERSRPQGGHYVVLFEGCSTREKAETLSGIILQAEPIDDPDALWVHDLIGCTVIDTGGVDHGKCVSILENPAHDLLELEDGKLVPVVFVLSNEAGVITIDPPNGLFDL
jgi:16S rRNA processing protein RimM